jgi:zinc transport system substrate-binding protein
MIIIFMRAWRARLGLVAAAASLLVATACGEPENLSGAGATQRGPLRIVVAFYPFQFVAERVAANHADITSLTAPGSEPHDLELTPRQVASIAEANLVIYARTFQPAVDEAVAQAGRDPLTVFDTSTVVPLENHGGAAEDSPGRHALDPHVWLDPIRLSTIVGAVADRLAAIDAANAADYRANAANLQRNCTISTAVTVRGLPIAGAPHSSPHRCIRLSRRAIRSHPDRHQRPQPRRRALARQNRRGSA